MLTGHTTGTDCATTTGRTTLGCGRLLHVVLWGLGLTRCPAVKTTLLRVTVWLAPDSSFPRPELFEQAAFIYGLFQSLVWPNINIHLCIYQAALVNAFHYLLIVSFLDSPLLFVNKFIYLLFVIIYNVWTCTHLIVVGFLFHHHLDILIFCNFAVVRTASVGKTPNELVVRYAVH